MIYYLFITDLLFIGFLDLLFIIIGFLKVWIAIWDCPYQSNPNLGVAEILAKLKN